MKYSFSADASAAAKPQIYSYIKQLLKILQGRSQLSCNPFRKDKLISFKGPCDFDIHTMCSMKGQPEHIKVLRNLRSQIFMRDQYLNVYLKLMFSILIHSGNSSFCTFLQDIMNRHL